MLHPIHRMRTASAQKSSVDHMFMPPRPSGQWYSKLPPASSAEPFICFWQGPHGGLIPAILTSPPSGTGEVPQKGPVIDYMLAYQGRTAGRPARTMLSVNRLTCDIRRARS